MQYKQLTTAQELQLGDRFYFPGKPKKVYTLTALPFNKWAKPVHLVMVTISNEKGSKDIEATTQVVFLRNK